MVTATIDTLVMDSDIVSWVDATGVKATACSPSIAAIPAADSVKVTIVSKPYNNTGTMASQIRIESATIIYTPANAATPAMASEIQTIGMTINNGGSAIVPIRVATQEQKILLQSALACNTPIYNYFTKIVFNITEIGTGKNTTIDASMQLRYADFIDK
jgi:hypothetical protein